LKPSNPARPPTHNQFIARFPNKCDIRMPAPRFEEADSDEEDSAQKALKAARAAFAQSKDIGEKYGTAILAALILIGLLYFWLVVLPKPLTVTVVVTEADSNAPISGAQVEAEYLASPYIFTSVKTNRAVPGSDGRYVFSGVPSNTEGISLRVKKTAEYENYDGLTNTATSAKTVLVKMFKKTPLRIESNVILGSIGPSCTKTFNVLIANNDTENDVEVALNATGLPYFVSEKKTISAGETTNVSFTIITNYPDSDKNPSNITGSVRIEGTRKTVAATIALTRKPELGLDSNEIANKVGETKLVEITNKGKGRITGVRLAMDDASRKIVELTGLNENEVFDLEPGQSKNVYATSVASGIGIISITADCAVPLELPVKITVPN